VDIDIAVGVGVICCVVGARCCVGVCIVVINVAGDDVVVVVGVVRMIFGCVVFDTCIDVAVVCVHVDIWYVGVDGSVVVINCVFCMCLCWWLWYVWC